MTQIPKPEKNQKNEKNHHQVAGHVQKKASKKTFLQILIISTNKNSTLGFGKPKKDRIFK
jgi:hypothetical protein